MIQLRSSRFFNRRGRFALLAFAALGVSWITGCTTIKSSERVQAVLLQTEPPGAQILVDGKYAARTPSYVLLQRSQQPKFTLRTADGDKTLGMETHYRWRASFFSGFVCYILAPACWAVDYYNGSAFEAVPPPKLKVRLSVSDVAMGKVRPPAVIAIAPPVAEHIEVSDAGGLALSEMLSRERVGSKVLPYMETLPQFGEMGFEVFGAPEDTDSRRTYLYHQLGLTSVVESAVESKGDEFVLRATEKNVFTNEAVRNFELSLHPPDELENMALRKRWWSRLLPNTVGVDFASTTLRLSRSALENYEMQPSGSDVWWASALRYMTVLNIYNMPSARLGRTARFFADFVPSIRVLRHRGRITGLTDRPGDSDQEFTRWWLSGGYGVEAGWHSGNHIVYFDFIPMVFWDEISWANHGVAHSYTGTGFSSQAEFGYTYYYTDQWLVRLFSRVLQEDSNGWQEVMRERIVPNGQTLSASTHTAGVTIAYRFEPKLSHKGWKRRQSYQ